MDPEVKVFAENEMQDLHEKMIDQVFIPEEHKQNINMLIVARGDSSGVISEMGVPVNMSAPPRIT